MELLPFCHEITKLYTIKIKTDSGYAWSLNGRVIVIDARRLRLALIILTNTVFYATDAYYLNRLSKHQIALVVYSCFFVWLAHCQSRNQDRIHRNPIGPNGASGPVAATPAVY